VVTPLITILPLQFSVIVVKTTPLWLHSQRIASLFI